MKCWDGRDAEKALACWRGSVGHREEEAELGSERRGQVENLPLEINALSESVP